jgi:aspartyl/glutamyl-tRNA(Asn/Gln) amidotransferase C subunit
MQESAQIDRAEIRSLAEFAQLRIPADRENEVAERLGRIVAAFASIAAIPDALLQCAPPDPPRPIRLRDDRPEAPLSQAEALANAPRVAAGAFLVPRVVDG